MQHGYSGVGVTQVRAIPLLWYVHLGYSLKSYKGFFISENFRSFKSVIFIFWSTVGSRNHAKQNCKGRMICVVNILK